MNNRLNRITALFLCLALGLSLAACGLTPAPVAEPESPAGTPAAQAPEPQVEQPASAPPAPEEETAPGAATAFVPLSISEVMASNKSSLADEQGLFPDWVELYHYGAEPLNTAGLVLSRDGERWPLPETTLEPGAYWLLFCDGSGENGRASFTLPKEGCVLRLETAEGALIEELKQYLSENEL